MIVIGLTGSIAMGKSEVAKILSDEGLPLFDADLEVHKLYDSEDGARVLRHLAPSATRSSKVDRAELSRLILDDPKILAATEQIIHAEIAKRRKAFLKQAEKQGHAYAVVDIPLLFETAGERDVDVTLVVSAPEGDQHARALKRPGMTQKKLALILKRQMPDAEKRKRADYIIENDSTLEDLKFRTLAVLTAIKSKAKA
jgi:dephospho-CoA kinase